LHLDGQEVSALPLVERKAILEPFGQRRFRDGFEIARICDAIVASGASQKWETVADY
jgi:ATP-dependent DNA ligase